jgi:hypothetical protein
MEKGKSEYVFQFACAPEQVDTLIQGWLQANQFSFQNKYGEDMYYYNDPWNGNRGFQYAINGNVLAIYAWTIGVGKQFYQIEKGFAGRMPAEAYKQVLSRLFTAINQLSTAAPMQQVAQTQAQQDVRPREPQPQVQMVGQMVDNMNQEMDKKAETCCEIGFWLSLVGLLISVAGISYGAIVYILIFYLGSQGLNTRKRGKAIASIVMSALSIVISVAGLLLNI